MVRIFRPAEDGARANYFFQQDNAPSHTAKVAKAYLKENAPHVLELWPADIPDLNSLDYSVWGVLDAPV